MKYLVTSVEFWMRACKIAPAHILSQILDSLFNYSVMRSGINVSNQDICTTEWIFNKKDAQIEVWIQAEIRLHLSRREINKQSKRIRPRSVLACNTGPVLTQLIADSGDLGICAGLYSAVRQSVHQDYYIEK